MSAMLLLFLLASIAHLWPVSATGDLGQRALLDRLATSSSELLFAFDGLHQRTGKPVSLLIKETFARPNRTGRLIIHTDRDSTSDLLHFWSANRTHLQLFWLQPFICSTSYIQIDSECNPPALLHDLLPTPLAGLFCRGSGELQFRGPSALLANLLDYQNSPLKLGVDQRSPEKLMLSNAPSLVFELVWPTRDTGQLSNGLGVQVILRLKTKIILQMSLLEIGPIIKPDDLRPPFGYNCPQSLPLQHVTLPDIPPPIDFQSAQHLMIRVEILRGSSSNSSSSSTNWPQDALQPLNPVESVGGDQLLAYIKSISLVTEPWQRLIVAKHEDKLTVWDLNSWHRFQISDEGLFCESNSIRLNKTTIFDLDILDEVEGCRDESVRIDLGDGIDMGLNEAALKLLGGQLEIGPEGIKYMSAHEFIHEALITIKDALTSKLCLFRDNRLLDLDSATIIRRYIRTGDQREYRYSSTSLLLFGASLLGHERSNLDLHINFDLLHREPYRPWSGSTQLLDLSACTSGASLSIEYPLSRSQEEQLSRSSSGTRELIRRALSSHLYQTHSVPLTRIPSIELAPLDHTAHLLTVKLRVLDLLIPKLETLRLDQSTESIDSYHELLRQSRWSNMAYSNSECASMCKKHNCSHYIFCKQLLICYLFDEASDRVSSWIDKELHCEAFKVDGDQSEMHSQWWRDHSPNLERLLDDVASSIQSDGSFFSKPRLSLVVPVGPKERPHYMQTILLEPSYAHYELDRQDTSLSMFSLALEGYKLAPSHGVKPLHDGRELDLGSVDLGFLVFMDEPDPSDCGRICLGEPSCAAFSHCPSSGECLITRSHDTSQAPKAQFGLDLLTLESPGCSILLRKHESQFELLGQPIHVGDSVAEVAEIYPTTDTEACASACAAKTLGCDFFDVCEIHQNSTLYCVIYGKPSNEVSYARKKLEDQTLEFIKGAQCQQYARNHLADFNRIPKRGLADVSRSSIHLQEDFVRVPSISLTKCASLCNLESNCGAFEWCSSREYGLSRVSCSLGNERTLARVEKNESNQTFESNQRCSVFAYPADSRGLYLKRRNSSDSQQPIHLQLSWYLRVLMTFHLELILFIVSFTVAILIRDNPLPYERLTEVSREIPLLTLRSHDKN